MRGRPQKPKKPAAVTGTVKNIKTEETFKIDMDPDLFAIAPPDRTVEVLDNAGQKRKFRRDFLEMIK